MPTTTTMSYSARIDSGSANNPALNLTGAPAITITFAPETISGGQGDLLLEGDDTTPDPDTVVYIGGTAYEFSFALTGTLPTLKKDGAQQVPDQFEGDPVYLIIVHDYPSAGDTTRVAYLPESNASLTEMDDFGNGAIDIQTLDESPPPTPVCFCSGTLIRTPRGDVPVEDLTIGDLVTTSEGTLKVLWTGSRAFDWTGDHDPHKPIVVPADAFGPGSPQRDLHVSPQHKIAFTCPATGEVTLCPAIGLTGWRGIRQRSGCRAARYHHILLERHAIVNANGVAAESFYPGATAMRMLSPESRAGLQSVLGGSGTVQKTTDAYGPQAGTALSRRQTSEARCSLDPLSAPGIRSDARSAA